MAKTKTHSKKEAASPFVPVEEQPYKVPRNWCWVYLESISDIIMGQSPSSLSVTDDENYTPLIGGAADMGEMYPNVSRYTKVITKVSEIGDLILCIRATLGRPIFSDGIYCLGRGVAAIRTKKADNRFLRYFILMFEQYLYDNATGSTFAQVSSSILQKMPVSFPPLSEQQRIVDHIESLFAKLDEAKEKAQAVVDGFELRKSAILHKAFAGELTAQWRKEHGVGMESWSKSYLGDLTEIKSSKRIFKEEYIEDGIPFFRSSEVVELYDKGYTEPQYFISNERYNEIKNRYGVPKQGDLLVTSVGTIGKTWIVDDRQFYYKDGNLTQVEQCQALDMKYLQFYISSEEFKEQIYGTVAGSAYNALTIIKFKKIIVPVPTREEQLEILQILRRSFESEQQAKEAAEAVLDQIDTMKKAILARAFRGELGTNNPDEEPAAELLKKI